MQHPFPKSEWANLGNHQKIAHRCQKPQFLAKALPSEITLPVRRP